MSHEPSDRPGDEPGEQQPGTGVEDDALVQAAELVPDLPPQPKITTKMTKDQITAAWAKWAAQVNAAHTRARVVVAEGLDQVTNLRRRTATTSGKLDVERGKRREADAALAKANRTTLEQEYQLRNQDALLKAAGIFGLLVAKLSWAFGAFPYAIRADSHSWEYWWMVGPYQITFQVESTGEGEGPRGLWQITAPDGSYRSVRVGPEGPTDRQLAAIAAEYGMEAPTIGLAISLTVMCENPHCRTYAALHDSGMNPKRVGEAESDDDGSDGADPSQFQTPVTTTVSATMTSSGGSGGRPAGMPGEPPW